MKKIVIILIIFFSAAILYAAGKEYSKGFELPYVTSFPPLTSSDIQSKVASDDPEGVLIKFNINSRIFRQAGYIFDDGRCLLNDSVFAERSREAVANRKWEKYGWNPPPEEFFQILEGAPSEDYHDHYEAQYTPDEIMSILQLLSDQEIYDPESRKGVDSDTGIRYGLRLYCDAKVASYRGTLLSGTNGEIISPLEEVNIALYEYLKDVLIPDIRDRGELIDGMILDQKLIESLEKYPYVLIYDRDNPDNILSGDLSLWES